MDFLENSSTSLFSQSIHTKHQTRHHDLLLFVISQTTRPDREHESSIFRNGVDSTVPKRRRTTKVVKCKKSIVEITGKSSQKKCFGIVHELIYKEKI
mmetsp:Transcript_20255/g.48256  ORF Transcript_20255/g.48256 Transcript_20255/m.48256 type:complete len:97 (-) Transcript_20255:205-495(-)